MKKDDSDPRIGRSRRWGFGRGKQIFGVHRMPSRSAVGWMASEGMPAYCMQYFSRMVKENARSFCQDRKGSLPPRGPEMVEPVNAGFFYRVQ